LVILGKDTKFFRQKNIRTKNNSGRITKEQLFLVFLQAKSDNNGKIERDGGENAGLQGCW
jgi:hypothetical protein